MKSGTRSVTFATPMPPATGRYHPAYKVANAQAAIRATVKQPIGSDKVRCLDFDTQILWVFVGGRRTPVAIGAHWHTLRQDGWTHYWDNGKLRPLKAWEQALSHQEWVDRHGWTLKAFHALRRPNGDSPMTHWEAVVYAKRYGVILCPELKSKAFGDETNGAAARLVDTCRKLDYPCWTMALLDMSWPGSKCAAIVRAGGQFAIIFGKWWRTATGPSRIAHWPVKPTQTWGPAASRRWLASWRKPA